MKAAVVLSVATTALGAIVVRDAQTVLGVISTSQSDIEALTKAVKAYSGDKGPLVTASDKLISDLKAGKQKVTGSGDLGLSDAVTLGDPVQKLAGAGGDLTDALKAKKSEVEKAGECKLVQSQIASIYSNSNDLINTVVGLVKDPNAKPIAKTLSGKLTSVLDDAKKSFEDCKDSGSSGDNSGSSSEASQPTSAAQTSAAAQTSEAAQTSAGNGGTVVVTTDCATSTGAAQPTNSNMPPVVNGAAAYAPAGIFAAVVAAFAL